MRPKRFNHFIIAGVMTMTAAGLVTVNGSTLARTIRIAQMPDMQSGGGPGPSGPGPGMEMQGDRGPSLRDAPQGSFDAPRDQSQSWPMKDQHSMRTLQGADGAPKPGAMGMDFFQKMMQPTSGQLPDMHGSPPPRSQESGQDKEKFMHMKDEMMQRSTAGQGQGVEKDMMKQFGGMGMKSNVMQDIVQQLHQDQNSTDDDACSAVDMGVDQMAQQLEEQSAHRTDMYAANKAKAKSVAVQNMWQKRIDNEPKKLAVLEDKLQAKADALRAKYQCDAGDAGTGQ